MCQVQAGAYVSQPTPGETKYSDCHPRKTTTYILHVVSITTHTHDRHKSIVEKETKKRKEDKGNEIAWILTGLPVYPADLLSRRFRGEECYKAY